MLYYNILSPNFEENRPRLTRYHHIPQTVEHIQLLHRWFGGYINAVINDN